MTAIMPSTTRFARSPSPPPSYESLIAKEMVDKLASSMKRSFFEPILEKTCNAEFGTSSEVVDKNASISKVIKPINLSHACTSMYFDCAFAH